MRKLSLLCGLLMMSTSFIPADAKHHDHDHDNYKYKNKYKNNYRGYKNYGQYRSSHNPSVNNDWSWERNQFRSRWGRMSASRRRALDAQMRQQWLAYHQNRWNGQYTWNNYSDPAFLDYLHTSNPSLLTQLRSYLGF